MTKRIYVILALFVGFIWGQAFPGIITPTPVQAQVTAPSRYRLIEDVQGMPYYLKLRHCAPAEDTLARLILVDYDPSNNRIVYRCRKARNY